VFDTNILYYAYDNTDGDDFGVGYLDNKQTWVERVNTWGRQDGARHDFKLDDFHELDYGNLRGCKLAEVVPDEQTFLVTWLVDKNENSIRIDHKGDFIWENNPSKSSSIPKWVHRLKRTIKEHKNQ
jgi:hypothetical protein